MSISHCPYCGSDRVVLLKPSSEHADYLKKIMEGFSPLSLVRLGMKLSRDPPIPPYLGGLIAVLIGGAVILISQHYVYRHYLDMRCCQCLDCYKSFMEAST